MKVNTYENIFEWNCISSVSNAVFGKDISPSKIIKAGSNVSYFFPLPDDLGEGHIELIDFAESMSVVIYNCKWKQPRSIHINEGDRVRLNFSLDLNMLMDLGEKDKLELSTPSWRLINHEKNSLVHEHISEDTPTIWVTISFDKHYLNEIMCMSCASPSEQDAISRLLYKSEGKLVYKEFPLDHNLNLIVSNIISINLSDALHLSYAKSKTDELICSAVDRIIQSEIETVPQIKLRKRDEDAILLAHSIIMNNLADVPSIRDICLMIGMNRNKFYYGFKYLFKMSLNKYLKQERLGRAYSLLVDTEISIIDIAAEVGFTHQSSLSTAFKAFYNISPIQLRNEAKNNKT